MDLRPINLRLYDLPRTNEYIVVPTGYELELRMMAAMCTTYGSDYLFERKVIWVETLGL